MYAPIFANNTRRNGIVLKITHKKAINTKCRYISKQFLSPICSQACLIFEQSFSVLEVTSTQTER